MGSSCDRLKVEELSFIPLLCFYWIHFTLLASAALEINVQGVGATSDSCREPSLYWRARVYLVLRSSSETFWVHVMFKQLQLVAWLILHPPHGGIKHLPKHVVSAAAGQNDSMSDYYVDNLLHKLKICQISYDFYKHVFSIAGKKVSKIIVLLLFFIY